MAPTLEWWELGLRLLGAPVFGGLIGFEREYNDQPAGFRTHILVTLGSALFTLAGAYGCPPSSTRTSFASIPRALRLRS